ncbi:hypothetical protein WA158_005369 [Blastocystis sp. Blastoise]
MSKAAETKAKPKMILGDKTFWVEKKIGTGGYGSVWLVTEDRSGRPLVIKRMECKSDELEPMMDNEFKVLRLVKNVPSCAKIYGLQKKKIFGGWEYRVLMEHCPEALISILQKMEKEKKSIPESGIWEIMYDITSAIAFLHKQKPAIAHRDLKLENILLSKNNTWKLIDFGSCHAGAVELKDKKTITALEDEIAKTTTQMYRAPELVDFFGISKVDEKVDMWALGCILYTLMFMKQPFQTGNKLAILGGKYPPPPRNNYSSELLNLMKSMLTPEQSKRITAADALKLIKSKLGKRSARRPTWLPAAEEDTSIPKFKENYGSDDEDDDDDFIDETLTDMDSGKKKATKKKSKFADSDDESEEELPKKKKASKFRDDSDDEDDMPKKKSTKKSSKFRDDSDDDDEEEERPKKKTVKKAKKVSYDSDDDEEEEEEKPKKKAVKKVVKKAKKVVVSEDEDDDDIFGGEEEEEEEEKPKKKAAKKVVKKTKKVVVSEDEEEEEEEEEVKPKKKVAKKAAKKPTTPQDDNLDDLFAF